MQPFTEKLSAAVDRVLLNNANKAWTKALADLDDLSKQLNKQIESLSHKKYGMALVPVPPEQYAEQTALAKCKIYRLVVVGEGRTKVLMGLSIIAVGERGYYPLMLLHDNFQPLALGILDCREILEEHFLLLVRHADSKFMNLVLSAGIGG